MESIEKIVNSGIIKLYILSFGVNVDISFLKSLNFDLIQENTYHYNVSNSNKIIEHYKIPSEILLPNDVECSIYLNKFSPIKLKNIDGDYVLTFNNKVLSSFEFNKKPLFFNQATSYGIPLFKYASMYGRRVLGLFVNGHCDYIKKGYPCKFCSL